MVTIPLNLLSLQDSGYHVLVEVSIFGKTFKAVLDTGASKTVFDKETIESILDETASLQDSEYLSSGLGTTSMQSFTLHLPLLKIGDWTLKNHTVAIVDLSTINYAYEQLNIDPVIGVIGGDILTDYRGVIDYAKLTLTLRERKKRPSLYK